MLLKECSLKNILTAILLYQSVCRDAIIARSVRCTVRGLVMYLCGRCVMYVQSRLLCVNARYVPKSASHLHTVLLRHSRTWRAGGSRFLSEQRSDSVPLSYTASRITEQETHQHALVPVRNSQLHHVSGASGPADQTSIGV